MRAPLLELIAASHTAPAADVYRSFIPTQTQLKLLVETGADILSDFPSVHGACASMSALYATRLQRVMEAPLYVVAGSLSIGPTRIFGEDAEPGDLNAAFNKLKPSWNGHCWLMLGGFIADISIFRTAYSAQSPPLLAHHISDRFGPGKGLLICSVAKAEEWGFRYEAQHVLTTAQIARLVRESSRI